jgi:hypothetical protein
MKPRFSILTLLGITAYVAVNAAAIASPLSGLVLLVLVLWTGIVCAVASVAAQSNSSTAVAARGTFFGVLTYFVAAWVDETWYTSDYRLPHFYVGEVLSDNVARSHYGVIGEMYRLAFLNVSLIFGLLGGSLALWHYRRQERRANQEKSGE